MARWFQYQAKTEPLPVPVVVVASFLSVVQFTGLFQYQVKAEPVLVPPPPAADVISPTTITSEVFFPRSIIYQSKTEPIVVPSAEVVTVDKWFEHLSEPKRIKIRIAPEAPYVPVVTVAAATAVEPTTVTSEVFFPRSVIYQSIARSPYNPEIITVDKWFEPLSEPTKRKLFINQQDNNPPLYEATNPANTVYVPLSGNISVKFRRQWQYQIKTDPIAVPAAEIVTEDKWHQAWSQPVRVKPKVVFQQTLAWSGYTPQAEVVTEDKWHQAWSQPVRIRPKVVFQQALAWSGFTPAIAVTTAIEPTTETSSVVFRRSILYQSLAWCPQTIVAPSAPAYFQFIQGDTGLIFQKTIIYQESAQAESPETHILWYQPLSEPVRQKRGLSSYLQQEPAWSTLTPAVTPTVTAVEPTTITSQVTFRRSIPYQSLAWCPQTITPPVFRYFNMVEGDTGLTFRKSIIYQVNTQPIQTEVPVLDPFWFEPLSEPVRQKRGLATNKHQALAWSGYTPPFVPPVTAVEPTTVTSQVTFQRSVIYQSLAWTPKIIIPETITEDKWHQPWSLPVRTRKFPTAEQQTLAWSGYTPATITVVYFPYVQGDTGLFFQKTIIYQESAQAESPETHIFWYQPWSEPVRQKIGLKTYLQQEPAWNTDTPATPPIVIPAIEPTAVTSPVIFRRSIPYQSLAWTPIPISAETITEDKWHQAWSQPVRIRTLATAQQQALVWSGYTPQPETITEDKWHEPWSEPVRTRRLAVAQQQFLAWITPEIVREDKWHQPWSIPVKLKKQFRTDLQQAVAEPPVYPNLLRTIPWYAPLAEPVRQKKGLSARLQQFFTTDANKPPQPPVFVILGATETNNDVASIFAVVYNPPVRCYVSIKEVPGSDPTYASIEETD